MNEIKKNGIQSLIINTKIDPRFAAVQTVNVCVRCMRNIEPVMDEQNINEYASIGKSHVMSAGFCPHCGLSVTPRLFSMN